AGRRADRAGAQPVSQPRDRRLLIACRMEIITAFLEQQPLLTLFLTIAIGYVIGEVSVSGFSLGVGAVLFVALAMGWLVPKAVPAAMLGTLGLAIFLYAVGVHYGRPVFLGFESGTWNAA